MMKNTAPGSVLITGAAQRVGKHLALGLSRMGWGVHLHYNASADAAMEIAEMITAEGGMCQLHQADLASPEAAAALIDGITMEGETMVLINNASLFEYDDASTVSAAMISQHMHVNMTAPAVMIRSFAERIRTLFPDTRGVVINITDAKLAGLNPDYFSYTLSKIALDGLTTLAAQAYAPYLRVNAIAPGIILRSGDQTEEEYRVAHQRNPLRQGARLDDILTAVKTMLDTVSMTGHTMVIDGGLHLQPWHRDVAYLQETHSHEA